MSSLQIIASRQEYLMIEERDEALDVLHRNAQGVTVVIPCFNQADSLHRALMSALQQTVSPIEVIIVDDGSDAEIVVPPEPNDFPHISVRVVRVTNRGLPSARNTGLMLTKTFAFLPLDADDWLDLHYIEKTLPLLQDAEVVLTGLQEHGPTRNGQYMPGFDRPYHEVTPDLILNEYNRFFYCSLFRTDVLRLIGGYNSRMSEGLEDADLWVTLLDAGARFAAIGDPLLNYNTSNPNGMLRTIHQNGGYERMVDEMKRHRLHQDHD